MENLNLSIYTGSSKYYPKEFRKQAATAAIASGKPFGQFADEHGIKRTTLYGWIGKYGQRNRAIRQKSPLVPHELAKENAELREELRVMKQVVSKLACL